MKVPVIAPDDLIATKLLAGRPKDLHDVSELLALGTAIRLNRRRLAATLVVLEDALGVSDLTPLLARLAAEVTTKIATAQGVARRQT